MSQKLQNCLETGGLITLSTTIIKYRAASKRLESFSEDKSFSTLNCTSFNVTSLRISQLSRIPQSKIHMLLNLNKQKV